MSEVVLTTHTTSAFKPGRHLSGREMQQAPPFSPKEPIFGPILPLTLKPGISWCVWLTPRKSLLLQVSGCSQLVNNNAANKNSV